MSGLPIHQDDHSYVDKLVSKFAQAIQLYRQPSQENNTCWVLFVAEDDERNICDQKVIEVQL